MRITITKERRLSVTVGDNTYEHKLVYGAIRNKVKAVFEPIDSILESSTYISNLFDKIYLNYVRTRDELQLYKSFVKFKWAVKEYIDKVDLFSEVKKLVVIQKKKNAIFFDKDNLINILYCSFYLKFYALFYATDLKPSREFHGKIFSNLLQTLAKKNILGKIYKLIQVKVFASASSDKPFWQYLKFVAGDSPETVCLNTYVNILENVLPVLSNDRNPITYIVVYATKTVDYIFISAYTDVFFYESMFYYDVTESQQAKSNDLLPVIILKNIIEKVITPLVNQVYNLDIEKIKKVVEVNPLSKVVAIPFFAKLSKMPLSIFRELNIYYTHVLSLYVAYVLKTLDFKVLPELLACAVSRIHEKQLLKFNKKRLTKLTQFIASPILQKFSLDNKLFNRLVSHVKGFDFFNPTKELEKPFKLPTEPFLEELYDFYLNLFNGKFNHTFKQLRVNKLNCFMT